jgi:hypothetical protein
LFSYGFVAVGDAVAFAGLFALAALLALPVVLVVVVLVVLVTAGVVTGVAVIVFVTFALFAGRLALTLTLVAVSPQAMPIALNPRTVESTITFFILFTDS